jgi:ABC-type branched-subunit amino acid transport system substrate-binding protein
MFAQPRRVLALVTVAALAVLAACSRNGTTQEQVPGVSDTEIVVGTHQPLTGPAAPGYSKISAATKAYFAYVNANGGVNGRKITLKVMDDGYNPANTQQVVRQLVLQDKVFAILNGLGTPTHTGVLEFLNTNRVPDLFVASGSRSWNQPAKFPNTFGYQTNYTIEGKILATYVKNNFAGKKVCHLGQADDFGGDSLVGIEQVLGASGLAAKDTYVPTNANVGPQLSKFKATGCEVVILSTVPGFTALTLGTAAKLSYRPQFVVSSVGGDYLTLAGRLGAAGTPLLEGLISAGYLPGVEETDNPWIQLFRKINTDYNSGAEFDGNVEYGMSVGYLFVQSLVAAGKDLTRAGIVAAVEKGGYSGPGLTPLQFSKDNHSGYSGLRMAKVTGGKQLPFGPIYVSDDAAGGVTEYSGTPAAPPANGIPS